MAITVLFNGLSAYRRFRPWRLDAAREKLETLLKQFVDAGVTYTQMREVSAIRPIDAPQRAQQPKRYSSSF